MAEYERLTARPRSVVGKQVKRLRRSGTLPGIIYGPAVAEPSPISVDARAFDQVYRQVGGTALVELAIDRESYPVFIRSVSRDPVRQQELHIEFYAPNLREEIVASVPVVITGELPSDVHGLLTYGRQEIEVRALPDKIPQRIEVDISQLTEPGATILVSELEAPEGVEIRSLETDLVVKLEAPAPVAEVPEQPEEEEEEVEEEAEEQPGETT